MKIYIFKTICIIVMLMIVQSSGETKEEEEEDFARWVEEQNEKMDECLSNYNTNLTMAAMIEGADMSPYDRGCKTACLYYVYLYGWKTDDGMFHFNSEQDKKELDANRECVEEVGPEDDCMICLCLEKYLGGYPTEEELGEFLFE